MPHCWISNQRSDGPIARVPSDQPNGRQGQVAEEREGFASFGDESEGVRAQALEERWRAEFLAGAGSFGHRHGEVEKVVQTGRQRRGVERYASFAAGVADPGEKGQDAAVPATQPWRVERDPRRGRLPPQFGFNGGGGGKPVLQVPSSSKPNQEDIALDAGQSRHGHRQGAPPTSGAPR